MNAVLHHATKLENKEELEARLLLPLGIEKAYIDEPTPMGAIGDIGLRPRDMLKFGLLYLNDGIWKGQQVVPGRWVRESTTAKIYPRPALGYGYFWWTKDFQWKGKPVSSFFAWGYGGQYIFVVPDVRLVMVMSGSNWSTDPEGQAMVTKILAAAE
jgi:CubicO group peptidase (beta-lactamase class C family)